MTSSFWYSLPLIASISLVYAATRDQDVGNILSHALAVAIKIAAHGTGLRGAFRDFESRVVGRSSGLDH